MPVRRQLRGRQRHAACAALFFHSIEVRIRRIHTDRYAPDPPLYPCAAEKRRSTGYGRRHPNRAYREYHITKPSQRCEADIAVKLNILVELRLPTDLELVCFRYLADCHPKSVIPNRQYRIRRGNIGIGVSRGEIVRRANADIVSHLVILAVLSLSIFEPP